jgi:CTP:molybdopterin cytidylyltransferase MocA
MPMASVAALIIAAGSSSRLGQPKQLLLMDGETLLQRAIRIAHQSGASPVLVVLGAHREQIEPRIAGSEARVVVNSRWEEGMASSIRAGIQAFGTDSQDDAGVLLMICDQPAVTAEHLRRMLASFREAPASAIASVYAGKRGIPAIFPREAFPSLLALRGDQGARGLLSDRKREVVELPLEGGELDIDRPEDISHLQSH